MTREDKKQSIETLKGKFQNSQYFYLTDSSSMTVDQVNKLRRLCFQKGIEMKVAKNTLIKKALEAISTDSRYEQIYGALHGSTAILFSPSGNAAAKAIKEFRKKGDKPSLKAAYIDSDVYLGDQNVETLSSLKSKEEVIADIVALINSPMKGVLAALSSSGSKLAGAIDSISKKAE